MTEQRKMNWMLYGFGVLLFLAGAALFITFRDSGMIFILAMLLLVASTHFLTRSRRASSQESSRFNWPLPRAVWVSAIILAFVALASLAFLYLYMAFGHGRAWPAYLAAGIVAVGIPIWAYTCTSLISRRWR